MTSAEIRQQYIDFFCQRHRHTFVPSSSVVPHDDPTLLFTNAGMNQFKPYFLGTEKAPWSRVANTQKCIRAGGKHNDLDDVGRSRRHGTFFEMLGNWSFGDYFKRGAIEMAWQLLTDVWRMDKSRLHVTCFEGDEANGVPRDTEAAELWKEIAGLPDEQIHFFGAKDNFWEMGDTGPCGPCTEINIDRRPQHEIDAERRAGGRAPVNGDDPRVMEFWNLVFIQYNRNPDRTLTPLPAQHVDTGMGFERICSILQNVDDMYAIELFEPFFAAISDATGFKYTGKFPATNAPNPAAEAADAQLRHDIAFRVIADHLRTLTFALTDGATPSNEGRGYVLRRILRRAVRFGRQQLELREPFMHKLVPVVVVSMGAAFPELKKNPQRVIDLIKDEEVSFGRTLTRGIELFNIAAAHALIGSVVGAETEEGYLVGSGEGPLEQPEHKPGPLSEGAASFGIYDEDLLIERVHVDPSDASGMLAIARRFKVQPTISGGHAFKLHDTYGFPIDLTIVMAQERGMSVDTAGYENLMEQARELARSGGKGGDTRLFELSPSVLAELNNRGAAATDDSAKFNAQPIGARVVAIWDGHRLLDATHGSEAAGQGVAVILDRTNFYAEMGGQVGDTGELRSKDGAVMEVKTTRGAGGYVLHVGDMIEGHLTVGDHVTATLEGVRPRTEKNHTATHLANWALREVLGEGVQQKGSLVDPDKLRFDFSHGKALGDEEVGRVEQLVNERIEQKLPVYAEVAPQEQALKIQGLRAVFGEKYPPMVRVVSIGAPVQDLLKNPTNPDWHKYSIEFCGGTHLKNTTDIEGFVVTSEESVSKGIRRLVALTGKGAAEALDAASTVQRHIQEAKAAPGPELAGAIDRLLKSSNLLVVPLVVKRHAQAVVAEVQAKLRGWEKTQKSASASSRVDVGAVSAQLLDAASSLGGGGKLVVGEVPGAANDQLLGAMDSIKKRTASYALLLASAEEGKVNFLAAVSDDLIAKGLKAGDWVREAAKAAGGGGGGRPNMAQAGGKDPSKLADALRVAREYATKTVK